MAFLRESFEFDKDFPCMIFMTDTQQVMMHSHDCLEINYILSGSGYYVMNDNTFSIDTGDIFVINNKEHHMAVHNGNLKILVIVFDAKFIWDSNIEYALLNPFFNENKYFKNRITHQHSNYEEFKELLFRIQDEFNHQEIGWQLIIKADLILFLGYLNRLCYQTANEEQTDNSKSYKRLIPVIEYIHEHYAEAITLPDLAAIVSMNTSYLSSYFSEVMKMTVTNYIVHVRINEAAHQLRLTDAPITDIALETGFNGISYFNRCFTKLMHKTPREYRKSISLIQK